MAPRPLKKSKVSSTQPNKAEPVPKPSVKSKGKQKADASAPLPSTFKVVAGSYEKLLYGLEGHTTLDGDKLEYHLKPIFIFPAHVSCIKAVAASPNGGKWLATGSADEIIKVWDLRRKKEIGGLMHHEGSITHLSFPSRSHLFSASEDGTLCLFRARDWAVLRALKGHKGRVNSLAVHPSSKVALTVGKDHTLRMWDLMRGRGVASTKLGKEGEIVRWSVSGSLLAVQSGSSIDIYDTEMTLLHTITHPARLHDIKFCKRVDSEDEVLLAGAEDKKLTIYDLSNLNGSTPPKIIGSMVGHDNRIKAIQTLAIALPCPTRKSTTIVSTVSSDGKIHIYDLGELKKDCSEMQDMHPVVVYDSKGTRLTCVTLADGDVAESETTGKRKRKDGDEGDAEDDDEDEDEWEGLQAEQPVEDEGSSD